MDDSDPPENPQQPSSAPHPRHHTIAQLTAAIAQAERVIAQCRHALEQQLVEGRNADRCRGVLRRTEAHLILLHQSRERVLTDTPAPLRRRRSRSR